MQKKYAYTGTVLAEYPRRFGASVRLMTLDEVDRGPRLNVSLHKTDFDGEPRVSGITLSFGEAEQLATDILAAIRRHRAPNGGAE